VPEPAGRYFLAAGFADCVRERLKTFDTLDQVLNHPKELLSHFLQGSRFCERSSPTSCGSSRVCSDKLAACRSWGKSADSG